jgi:adenosylcobyric acid synthase
VAAIRLPRISNSTDVEALACEPGVLVRWISDPADLADTDLVVLPGSKATVSDLSWLRDHGLADAIIAHARAGKPVLGICGGFQMLCRRIDDPVESGIGDAVGLGLLDVDIAFHQAKTLRRWQQPLTGYEIHHGRLSRCAEESWFGPEADHDGETHGVMRGAVFGTHWHGLLDNDDFRRAWLTRVADAAGRSGFAVAEINVAARRDAQLDLAADLLASHLDVAAVLRLLEAGPPRRPHIASQLRP